MTSPNRSVYTIDGLTGAASSFTVGTTEAVYKPELYDIVIPWPGWPGTQLRAGISGRFQVGANPVIIRVRGGQVPPVNDFATVVTGDLWFQTTLPADTVTDLGALGDLMSKPSDLSIVEVTIQAVGGDSDCVFTSPVVTLVPGEDGGGQGILLSNGAIGSPSGGVESADAGVGYEWIVDFDQFEGVSNLVVAVAAQCGHPFGGDSLTMRVRVGGTSRATNGAVIYEFVDDNVAGPPLLDRLVGGSTAFANTLAGPQLVTLTVEGRAIRNPGLILREQ